MKLQIVSDVHVEFHADGGLEWANALPDGGCDALVVAGDFGTHNTWMAPMEVLCRRFPRVIYVTGNHEYYGSCFDDVHREVGIFDDGFDNFHWLNNDVLELDGGRILGTTMWFRQTHQAWRIEWRMNDFRTIADAQSRIYEENKKAVNFLSDTLREGDVVVTHHLPSKLLISDRFKGSLLNAFFVCDMDELIKERRPALWVHGHTHDSKDIHVEGTRVVCNPFGYARCELNPGYEEPKIVEVSP